MSSTFPSSPLYALKETPSSGRGVFATQSIPANTPILQTSLLPASVIYREYKREVCAQCFFAHNHSRDFKLRISETGHSFCGRTCLRTWKDEAGEIGLAAWNAIETLAKTKKTKNHGSMKGNVYDSLPDEGAERPSVVEIKKAWDDVEKTAALIRQARAGSMQKTHRKALQSTLSLQSYPDTLSLLLSGILTIALRPKEWPSVLTLVEDKTPYTSPQDLAKNVQSYLHLLALLPTDLLPHVTVSICYALVSRDSHNSFGIHSLDGNGAEMFGFGVWPLASYFNHSCAPSVLKRRIGRGWEFWTSEDVIEGQELCISYMGGDERELSVRERRKRTAEIWGFVCECERCCGEEGEVMSVSS